MAKIDLFRCLVISPSDVAKYRDAIRDAIASWNAQIGRSRNIRIEPVMWESHSRPEVGDYPQAIINQQIVDDCDLGVAVFWTRLGSATKEYESGSVEEIKRLGSLGAPVMVYFSDEPVKPSAISIEQAASLRSFRDDFQKKALTDTFVSGEELQRKVIGHLTSLVDAVLVGTPPPNAEHPTVITAPRPDIRVTANTAFLLPEPSDPRLRAIITVHVENHSPQDFFFHGMVFETNDNRVLQPMRDAISGEWIAPKVVKPGDSLSYQFSAAVLLAEAEKAGVEILCACVTDRIRREFRSSKDELKFRLEQASAMLKGK